MIRTLPATADPTAVQDALHDMTDGSTYVIAMEVWDHPEAVHVANGARYGGDGGREHLGVWILGTPGEVWTHLAEHGYESYQEQYGMGLDTRQGHPAVD